MTSKELPADVLKHVRQRLDDHAVISAGKLPLDRQLHGGAPFYCGRMDLDIQHWTDEQLAEPAVIRELELHAGVKRGTTTRALRRLRTTCTDEAMVAARAALHAIDHQGYTRLDIYLACSGDEGARHRVARWIAEWSGGWPHRTINDLFRSAVTRGLDVTTADSMEEYCRQGMLSLRRAVEWIGHYDTASKLIEGQTQAAAERTAADEEHDDREWLEAVMEDRAEFFSKAPPLPRTAGLVVVPRLADAGTSWKKEIQKGWQGKSGVRLPLVARGDIAGQRRRLAERYPQAIELVDIILGDLSARTSVVFRPTLLVGSPGSGKSSLARAICDEVGLPVELVSLAAVHDAALMGTSAQWNSARESTPLQLIKRTAMASVAVIWDEIEKVGTRTDSGNAMDALLPMLEPDQARRYRDLALEIEVDLSAVSHFATANSLEGIPEPLRDRMRVLAMPDPGWQHLHTLTRQILDRLAKERGLDPRWFEALAEDELDLVRTAWPGGSIRQLTTIVRALIDGRGRLMGRH